jgi:hypothetical protein
MKNRPRRLFSFSPRCDDDNEEPAIPAILSLENGQTLVMSDHQNNKVKLVDLEDPPRVTSSITIDETP